MFIHAIVYIHKNIISKSEIFYTKSGEFKEIFCDRGSRFDQFCKFITSYSSCWWKPLKVTMDKSRKERLRLLKKWLKKRASIDSLLYTISELKGFKKSNLLFTVTYIPKTGRPYLIIGKNAYIVYAKDDHHLRNVIPKPIRDILHEKKAQPIKRTTNTVEFLNRYIYCEKLKKRYTQSHKDFNTRLDHLVDLITNDTSILYN